MSKAEPTGSGLEITLHRTFDMIGDWREATDQANALGVTRILTYGGAPLAESCIDRAAFQRDSS